MKHPAAIAALIFFPALGILAQSPGSDTATIKLSNPDTRGIHAHWAGPNRFATENYTLRQSIGFAYYMPPRTVSGGPAWIYSERFDTGFAAPNNGTADFAQARLALQAVLADRFKLQLHREQTMGNVYNLVIGKTELKLKPSAERSNQKAVLLQGPPSARVLPARNATIADFIDVMQMLVVDRPIIDKTGLAGKYDFDLEWAARQTAPGGAGPDLLIAIQNLGLQLEPAQGLVDKIAVDYIEQPALN